MTDHRDELDTDTGEEEDPGWPISFLLLVGAGGVYLVLRFVQLARDLL